MSKLVIRYANPDTTPRQYGPGIHAEVVTTDDYWTLHGPMHALRHHVEQALADNNLNDYGFVGA